MKCPNCGEPLTLYIRAYPFDREYACRRCGFIGWTTFDSPLKRYVGDIPRLVFLYRERVAGR